MRKWWHYYFWLWTEILMYVHFTYINIFSEGPCGSFTKISDVILPRLSRVIESNLIPLFVISNPPSPNHYYTYLDPASPVIVKDDLSITDFRFKVRRSISLEWRGRVEILSLLLRFELDGKFIQQYYSFIHLLKRDKFTLSLVRLRKTGLILKMMIHLWRIQQPHKKRAKKHREANSSHN